MRDPRLLRQVKYRREKNSCGEGDRTFWFWPSDAVVTHGVNLCLRQAANTGQERPSNGSSVALEQS